MNKQIAPGQLAAIKGAVVRCMNCGAVETFTSEVKGGWHDHAQLYGWKAFRLSHKLVDWHCPKCVAQREAQATTTERDAFGVPYNREPAPNWNDIPDQPNCFSGNDRRPLGPEKRLIASAAKTEPLGLSRPVYSQLYIEQMSSDAEITVNGERILDIVFRLKPGDILTTSYPDIDGAVIKKTFKVDADGVHLIPLES